jgi:hypothetical protein
MLGYLIIIRPFVDLLTNLMHIFNELVLLFSFVTIFVLDSVNAKADTEETWGLIILITVFISLLSCWGMFLPTTVAGVLAAVSNALKKDDSKAKGKKRKSKRDEIINDKVTENKDSKNKSKAQVEDLTFG